MIKKIIQNIIFPCPPSIESQQQKHLLDTQKQLHLLELHHLDTIAALEHYTHAKQELLCRIQRLTAVGASQ